MIAAVYHAPGDVRVEDMPEPRDPAGADVVLEVTRAAICGTDASEYAHAPKFFPIARRTRSAGTQGPTIMGHEFTGRVIAIGPGARASRSATASSAAPASRAASASGACAGRTNLCARYYTLGLHTHGGLAPYVGTPGRRSAGSCRTTCSDDAAAMAQPLAVALHALRRSGAAPGQSVAVHRRGRHRLVPRRRGRRLGLHAQLIAVDIDDARLEKRARPRRLAHRQRRRDGRRRGDPRRPPARAPTSCSRPPARRAARASRSRRPSAAARS